MARNILLTLVPLTATPVRAHEGTHTAAGGAHGLEGIMHQLAHPEIWIPLLLVALMLGQKERRQTILGWIKNRKR